MGLNIRSFDEVNSQNELHKAVEYEKYFGEMDLTEEQKQERISLAEKLEENFLFVLALLFTMQQYNAVDWETIRVQFQTGYLNALSGTVVTDDYIQNYVRTFAYNVVDSTKAHQDDPYYYTQDRAAFMAENEANAVYGYTDFVGAVKSGKTMKTWLTMRDRKVRETHKGAEGKTIPINDIFLVGNSMFRFPKDTLYSPDSSDLVGCRCSIKYF